MRKLHRNYFKSVNKSFEQYARKQDSLMVEATPEKDVNVQLNEEKQTTKHNY